MFRPRYQYPKPTVGLCGDRIHVSLPERYSIASMTPAEARHMAAALVALAEVVERSAQPTPAEPSR